MAIKECSLSEMDLLGTKIRDAIYLMNSKFKHSPDLIIYMPVYFNKMYNYFLKSNYLMSLRGNDNDGISHIENARVLPNYQNTIVVSILDNIFYGIEPIVINIP